MRLGDWICEILFMGWCHFVVIKFLLHWSVIHYLILWVWFGNIYCKQKRPKWDNCLIWVTGQFSVIYYDMYELHCWMGTVNRYFRKQLDLDEMPQNVAFHHGLHCLHLEIITCEPSISIYNRLSKLYWIKVDGKLHGSTKGDNFLIITIKQNARFQFPLMS